MEEKRKLGYRYVMSVMVLTLAGVFERRFKQPVSLRWLEHVHMQRLRQGSFELYQLYPDARGLHTRRAQNEKQERSSLKEHLQRNICRSGSLRFSVAQATLAELP